MIKAEETAKDIEAVIRSYLSAWQKSKVVLIGYSLGADVLPFIVNRLQPGIIRKVSLVVLLGPGQDADFEFHIGEWVGLAYGKTLRPVLPEAEKMKEIKTLCIYGEKESICKSLKSSLAKAVLMKGGHHFGGDYSAMAEVILQEMK